MRTDSGYIMDKEEAWGYVKQQKQWCPDWDFEHIAEYDEFRFPDRAVYEYVKTCYSITFG